MVSEQVGQRAVLGNGIFSGDDPNASVLTFKVSGISKENVKKSLGKIANKFWNIRQSGVKDSAQIVLCVSDTVFV